MELQTAEPYAVLNMFHESLFIFVFFSFHRHFFNDEYPRYGDGKMICFGRDGYWTCIYPEAVQRITEELSKSAIKCRVGCLSCAQ